MNQNKEPNLKEFIKAYSLSLGFDLTGIARVRHLDENERILKEWVAAGMNDIMAYLGRETGKRSDPRQYMPGTKSVIITGINYYRNFRADTKYGPVISRYAHGKDYHIIIKKKLDLLASAISKRSPSVNIRTFIDTSPVLEKPWAVESGLGWQGRNSVVINKSLGSFFFLGGLITDLDIMPDEHVTTDLCGACRICIESCPTKAINENRTIDARKCIASLTIENRGPIPEDIIGHLGGRVYGCDLCQEVCPWNRSVTDNKHIEFEPVPGLLEKNWHDWLSLTEEDFNELFAESPLLRVKYDRFMNNMHAAYKSVHPE